MNYPANPPGLDFAAWNIGDALYWAHVQLWQQDRATIGARISTLARREVRREREESEDEDVDE